jgi:anti-sigma factor RsiW
MSEDMELTPELLEAWLADELAPEERDRVARALREDPEARARIEAWQRDEARLRAALAPVLDEPVPERLARAAAGRRPRAWTKPLAGLAAGLVLLLAGGLAGWIAAREVAPDPRASHFAEQAASAHRVFGVEVRHPVEVPASQEAHLVGWLSKRLGYPIAAPDFARAGYRLVGGRLLADAHGPAAQLMYEDATGRRVTAYFAQRPQEPETAFRFVAGDNVNVFYWIDHEFGFALAGDVPRETLLQMANTAYATLDAP